MKTIFYNQGQAIIRIVITFIIVGIVGLITSELYFYFSKQFPAASEIAEKLPEEKATEFEKELPEKEITPEEKIGEKSIEETKLEISNPKVYVQQKCSDNTPFGQCSNNKPKYCDNGNLIDKCETCGCFIGEKCHSWYFDYYCLAAECSSDQDCNDNKEKTIDSCELSYEEKDAEGRPKFACSHKLALRGDIKIAIVEFEAEGTNYSSNFLQSINNKEVRKIFLGPYKDPFSGKETTESFFSFYYLEDFFKQEAKRYSKNVSVSVNILGPYILSDLPPARKGIDPCEPTLGNFFEGKREKYNLNLSSYDIVNYVYFSNKDNAFYGCYGRDKNTYIAVGRVEVESLGFFSSAIRNLAHEAAHKFGASDKYAGYGCVYPSGYVEPNKDPLHPQFEACLMCGLIPIEEKTTRIPVDISEVRVCEKTAEEIGLK